jgi:methylmalonyl-CoA/ethylmalonyl-CoA epimerase
MLWNRVHGVNIAVRDLEHWTHRYEEMLGVKGEPVAEAGFAFPGLRGTSFDLKGFNLNLISSDDPTTSVGRFLERKGDGFFLLSLRVDDVDQATAELREQGIPLLLDTPARGETHLPVNFVHPREMGGVQIEIIEMP